MCNKQDPHIVSRAPKKILNKNDTYQFTQTPRLKQS